MQTDFKEYEVIIDTRNQRVKVLRPPQEESKLQSLALQLPVLAKENNCTKITIYSIKAHTSFWSNLNYRYEGMLSCILTIRSNRRIFQWTKCIHLLLLSTI